MTTALTTPLTMPLEAVRSGNHALVGGKSTGLGELIGAGLDVPEGYVITTEAYRRVVGAFGSEPTPDAVRTAPLPDDVRAAVLIGYSRLGSGVVAVRSSATAEDLPGAAFAGAQDTVLGVVGNDALVEAIRTCWASLWGERARAYRNRLGIDPRDVAIAVVVQRLVDAEHAGVMLTANPVTGARDETVIDSSPGLGEAVVSGLVTPDHAVVGAAGRVVARTAGAAQVVLAAREGGGTRDVSGPDTPRPALSDETLTRLAEAGRRIEAHSGRPMDIEWAVTGDRIVMLQARPMTALPPPPRKLTRVQLTAGPVILELLPRRPTPLELTAWLSPLVAPLVERMLEEMAGIRLDFDDVLPASDGIVTEFVPPSPRPTWRVPAAIAHGLAASRRGPRGWVDDPLAHRYDAACRALAHADWAALSWDDLQGVQPRVRAASDLLTQLRIDYLPAAGAAIVQLQAVLWALGLRDRADGVLTGIDTATTAANAELAAIADLVRSDPTLTEIFATRSAADALRHLRTDPAAREVRRRFEDFLTRYGHRETTSITLVRDPSWADSPETVVAIVRVLLEGATRDPAGRGDPLEDLLAHPSVRRLRLERLLRRIVARARDGFAAREDTHFAATRLMPPIRHALLEVGRRLAIHEWLDDPDDVWFLTWPQITALPDPATDPPDPEVRRSALRRRAAYAELASTPLIATATLYPEQGRGGPGTPGAIVTGTGGGGGRASGAVRIVHGPEEFGTLRPGEVLVCSATNPSWTPLFSRAAAVVVDHGGIASHAAIVAREYGLPAVMGCGTATATLSTGQQVVVDGDRGLVLPQGQDNGKRV